MINPENGKVFYDLHHNGKLLVLPNIWDPLGAALLEDLGYPAIATASASVAYSNGYRDGENIPFNKLLSILQQITSHVKIPVSADIEHGYASTKEKLADHIKQLIDTGIAGINFEDSNPVTQQLVPIDKQCEKISLIRKTAKEAGVSLFINARTDTYIHGVQFSAEEKLAETIQRGKAYKEAGADGFYPITLADPTAIEAIVSQTGLPLNLLLIPGIPNFNQLGKAGVTRLSLGPGYLKIALNAMKNIAEKLLNQQGMNDIAYNAVTTDYIKNLFKSNTHEEN